MAKQSAATFGDIAPVMQAAMDSPEGVRYRLATYGLAVNFRQRFYTYKKAKKRLAAERLGVVPGAEASVPEDGLVLSIENAAGEKIPPGTKNEGRTGPHDVVIRHRVMAGELLDLDGNPLELGTVTEDDYEPLDVDAMLMDLDLEDEE